jgi:hypothetical protein
VSGIMSEMVKVEMGLRLRSRLSVSQHGSAVVKEHSDTVLTRSVNLGSR